MSLLPLSLVASVATLQVIGDKFAHGAICYLTENNYNYHM